jgi:hypothetical protein
MWVLSHPLPDLVILVSVLGMSWLLSRVRGEATETGASILERTAARPVASYVLIGALAFFGSAAVSLLWEFPQPRVHDEFSYLLAADTFNEGRLANAPHPRWQHFESFHILQQPTYASRYPPAQGLVLALGTRLGGHPIVGVWLSAALGSMAILWMARAWLPPSWALFASLLAVLRIGIGGYWAQSYFGGWVAATGGALLLGGLRQTLDRPTIARSLALAGGLVILSNSRPFEGVLLALPCALVLLVFMARRVASGQRDSFKRIVLPIAVVMLANILWIGAFNQAVTGDPGKLPHQLYADTYMSVPNFLFQPPPPRPKYRHPEMARFHTGWEQDLYEKQLSWKGRLAEKRQASIIMWRFFLGVVLTIPLLLLPWFRRDPWMLFALGLCLFYLASIWINLWNMPHYAAPFAPLVFILVAHGVRSAHESQRWQALGFHLRRALPVACLAVLGFGLVHPNRPRESPFPDWHLHRARILEDLERQGGQHLIIVRYRRDSPRHYPHEEWVYNRADIDAAPVVWAREMSPPKNRRLLKYFADRTVWLLEADVEEPHLQRYPSFPGVGNSSG